MFFFGAWHGFCHIRTLDWEVYQAPRLSLVPSKSQATCLGLKRDFCVAGHFGRSFEPLNVCLFAPALSHDLRLVQLHAQVSLLSATLVANDLHARSHLASVMHFLSLLKLHSYSLEWNGGTLGAISRMGILASVAEEAEALTPGWCS